MAFELFRRAGVDVAVCEVGLGGRLDATNVVDPTVTAITSIGFDHQQYLGHTLAEIAREKAGIIKPGVPVVVGRAAGSRQRVDAVARRGRRSSRVEAPSRSRRARTRIAPYDAAARLRRSAGAAGDTRSERGGGGARARSSSTVAACRVSAGGHRDWRSSRSRWPGRLEVRRLPDGREVLLDAAHNPDGAAALRVLSRDDSAPRAAGVRGHARQGRRRR